MLGAQNESTYSSSSTYLLNFDKKKCKYLSLQTIISVTCCKNEVVDLNAQIYYI